MYQDLSIDELRMWCLREKSCDLPWEKFAMYSHGDFREWVGEYAAYNDFGELRLLVWLRWKELLV